MPVLQFKVLNRFEAPKLTKCIRPDLALYVSLNILGLAIFRFPPSKMHSYEDMEKDRREKGVEER